MKTVLATLALLFQLSPSVSHALVVSSAECTTANGEMNVSIIDNQGTGFDRSSHMVAVIQDKQGNVIASVPVQIYSGITSASFGRPTYIDSATLGATLSVQGPSTNERNYVLHYASSQQTISDENLNCVRFMGQTY